MSNEKKNQGLYLEIDCLFDTRLATLRAMDESLVDEALLKGYFLREREEFHGYDALEFRKAYASRDKEILKKALPTKLLTELNDIVNFELVKPIAMGGMGGVNMIYLNTWPYELTHDELDMFVMCLKKVTGYKLGIRPIRANPKSLTPEYLNNNINMAYIYDWNAWLDLHAATLLARRVVGLSVIGPRLLPLTLEESEQQRKEMEAIEYKEGFSYVKEDEDKTKDAFYYIEKYASMFVQLDLDSDNLFNQYFIDGIPYPNVSET